MITTWLLTAATAAGQSSYQEHATKSASDPKQKLLQMRNRWLAPHDHNAQPPQIDHHADQRLRQSFHARGNHDMPNPSMSSADRISHQPALNPATPAMFLQQPERHHPPSHSYDENGWVRDDVNLLVPAIIDYPSLVPPAPGVDAFHGSTARYRSQPMPHPNRPMEYPPETSSASHLGTWESMDQHRQAPESEPRFQHFSNRIPASERVIRLEDELTRMYREMNSLRLHNQSLSSALKQNEQLLNDIQLSIDDAIRKLTAAEQANHDLRNRILELEREKREQEQTSSKLFDDIRSQLNDLLAKELTGGE